MKHTLATFQDAFIATLYGGFANAQANAPANANTGASLDTDAATRCDAFIATLATQPGFSVYRNTVFKGCIDALAANFPTVVTLVGDTWFRAAAVVHVQSSPPADARLLYYGADFAAFIERFEPARELPYLGDVARLDRLWTEAHAAANDTLADPMQLAELTPDQMERVVLRPHAAARWRWFDTHPAWTIWRATREGDAVPDELVWQGEGALLTRPSGNVQWHALTRGGAAFMTACAQGSPLAAAAGEAIAAEPAVNFALLLPMLLQAGAIAQIDVARDAR